LVSQEVLTIAKEVEVVKQAELEITKLGNNLDRPLMTEQHEVIGV